MSMFCLHSYAAVQAYLGKPELMNKLKEINAPYVLVKYER